MGTCHPMATLKYIDSVRGSPVTRNIKEIKVILLKLGRPLLFDNIKKGNQQKQSPKITE